MSAKHPKFSDFADEEERLEGEKKKMREESVDVVKAMIGVWADLPNNTAKRIGLINVRDELESYELTDAEKVKFRTEIDDILKAMNPEGLGRAEIEEGMGIQYHCDDCGLLLCGKCTLRHFDMGHVILEHRKFYGKEMDEFWCDECGGYEEKEKLITEPPAFNVTTTTESPRTAKKSEPRNDSEIRTIELLTVIKTNPDVLEEELSPEMKTKIANVIRARMERKGAIEAMDFEREIGYCLARCEDKGGTPQLRTRYAGERFEDREHPGRFLVLFVCYGKGWSQWFDNVSIEDIEKLESD